MKKFELTVVRFEEEDVICTSQGRDRRVDRFIHAIPAPEELIQESNP